MQTILVIEYEPSVADNVTYALGTENFRPIWCATGVEGEALLARGGVDLVVLDVGLPDVNGFELCKRIRLKSDVPIIFLTARADEVDRVVGLEIGADDYLVKPFSPRELTARVKAVLRRSGPRGGAPRPPATGFPFVVDEERFLISYFGAPLRLTRYEYRILEILVAHPGRIYSRDTLMDLAWEEPEASMERTVDAHIKSVRAKLEEGHPGEDPVITHRGLGYSLREEW